MDFWMSLWTFIWFLSLGIFALLSVLVIILGGRDLKALLAALRQRHEAAQTQAMAEEIWEPPVPPAPPAP